MIGRNIAEDKSYAAEMAASCALPTGLGDGSERLPRPPRQENRLAEGTWQMAGLSGFRDLRSVNVHRSAMGHVRNARYISLLSSWLLSETARGSSFAARARDDPATRTQASRGRNRVDCECSCVSGNPPGWFTRGSWAITAHWRRTSNPGWTAAGQNVAAQAKPAHGRQEQGDRAWFGNRSLHERDQALRGGRAVVGGRGSQQERAGRQAELGRAISAQIDHGALDRVEGCRDGRARRPVHLAVEHTADHDWSIAAYRR